MAAQTAPVEPVPELMVSPAPRSQNRTSSVCRSDGADEGDVGAVGEMRMRFDLGAHAAPVEIEILHKDRALRIADVEQSRLPLALRQSEAEADLLRTPRGPAHVHLEGETQTSPVDEPQFPQARPGPDAERGSRASSGSTRNAAAQRVPLPEISASLPSALKSRISASQWASSPASATSIQPSAPMPVWRSQIARAAAVQSLARRLAGPGQQEIVLRAVRFGERNSHHLRL